MNCPCGSDTGYDLCCGPIHAAGAGLGTTAEQLMRARYSAYVQHNAEFLRQSWHPDSRPATLSFDDATTWLGLTIEATTNGTGMDSIGTVEFRARFSRDTGQPAGAEEHELHELSSFVRIGGTWFYTDGINPG